MPPSQGVATPYTDADVQIVREAFDRWRNDSNGVNMPNALLGALAAAGRLLPPNTPNITVIDVAMDARMLWGDKADYVAGRILPDHDYRFELRYPDGARATMHVGAMAGDVAADVAWRAREETS